MRSTVGFKIIDLAFNIGKKKALSLYLKESFFR